MSSTNNFNQNIKNPNLESDPFWYTDPQILVKYQRITEFFPVAEMTLVEKLNSLQRLSIYIGIILTFSCRKYTYLFIPILMAIVTFSIYKYKPKNMELFFNSLDDSEENNTNKKILRNKPCIQPTYNNPFMNYNIITDFPKREPACPSWNDKEVREEIEDKFNYNLYRDVSDLYGKSNSQREYYTMPSTTNPNNQTAFAKWCYNAGPTCKEDTIRCVPQYTFFETGEDFVKFTN
jgi:hypothetical protein